ncbi:MAG: acyloxyacyl hydrolase [Pseudomonadota bacterium]|nr:acyloxyacyl hydrolase [Pseudomonadota bacterium]
MSRLPVLPVLLSTALPITAALAAESARDGVAIEAGSGYHVDMARLSLNREWERKWFTDHSWVLGGYWDLSLGAWHAHNPAGGNHDVTDVGITPVWRVTERERSAIAPYGELAVGAHYISEHRIYSGRDMSTHFQFGDHVGAGVSFGEQHAWDLGLRLQHMSNAGLKNPNPGINFYQIRAGYHF